jgi:Tol biopolymer transport system component
MKKRLALMLSAFLILGLTFGMSYMQRASATVPGVNQLIDQNTSGTAPNNYADFTSPYLTSGDGRYVAFSSYATDIATGSTYGVYHAYVRDAVGGVTVQADISTTGVQADQASTPVAISNDGRYVLFNSYATNLIDGQSLSGGATRPYVRDRVNSTTALLSGSTGTGISSDGKYAMTGSITNPVGYLYSKQQVFIQNLQTGAWQLASADTSGNPGNKDSIGMGMSCSGNVIAFASGATNLPGNANTAGAGVNLFIGVVGWSGIESLTNVTNVTTGTGIGNAQVSCDGNEIAYVTGTLTGQTPHAYKYNRLTGTVTEVGKNTSGGSVKSKNVSISGDGRYVVFTSDISGVDSAYTSTYSQGYSDVYIRDTKNSTTQLVTFNTSTPKSRLGGGHESAAISADGSKIAYSYQTPSSNVTVFELIPGVYNSYGGSNVYMSNTGF